MLKLRANVNKIHHKDFIFHSCKVIFSVQCPLRLLACKSVRLSHVPVLLTLQVETVVLPALSAGCACAQSSTRDLFQCSLMTFHHVVSIWVSECILVDGPIRAFIGLNHLLDLMLLLFYVFLSLGCLLKPLDLQPTDMEHLHQHLI